MYIFGGFDGGDRHHQTYKFNFKTGEWHLVQHDGDGTHPTARSGHSACANETHMYVFGGRDNDDNRLNDLWRLNLENEKWELLSEH